MNVLLFGSESKFIVVTVLIQTHQPQWLFASALNLHFLTIPRVLLTWYMLKLGTHFKVLKI